MTQYLLDTNVILRFSNPSDRQYELVVDAIATLLQQGDECYLTAQVLIEFWVVATRPIASNGLGWPIPRVHTAIEELRDRFPMAEETSHIFPKWLSLVATNQVRGKRTHDARIVAVMLTSDVSHILTLNPDDFSGMPGIAVVHPRNILQTIQEPE